ncbi:MAG: hypothetical protein KC535_01685 [Nanoarchaeota archaeon]|nr:hypothetical protein [Nanoarchaeota archaeon]
MRKNNIIFLFAAGLLVLLSACSSTIVGPADELAQCLTDSGAVMYGTEWCPHCKAQKEMFGTSFQYVTYVDCDKYPQACTNAGIQGYPTWVIDGANYPGTQSLYDLAKLSGCSLSTLEAQN